MRIKFTHAVHDCHIEETSGPKYRNCCGHRDSEYVGTVKTWPSGHPVDVYVHEGALAAGIAHVCIRYGNEGHEYASPGTVLDFLAVAAISSHSGVSLSYHKEVAALLLKRLDFFCEIKKG